MPIEIQRVLTYFTAYTEKRWTVICLQKDDKQSYPYKNTTNTRRL